jgi:putative transposase
VARSKNGQAISPHRRTPKAIQDLEAFLAAAKARGDFAEWRRAKAVLSYIHGKRVIDLAEELDTKRSSVNTWISWYEKVGLEGLRTRKPPGPAPKLTPAQREQLAGLIDAGPQASGYATGIWTGPMIGDLIARLFGVSYHNHHVPRLLHQLGFSVQRPRKRLARADIEAQAVWLRDRLPRIKKKQRPAEGS